MSAPGTICKLFPEHQADLGKSGLLPETIQAAGLYSIDAADLEPLIGWAPSGVKSALVFPYGTGGDGFCRVKVFPAYRDRDGHVVKYLQRPGSGCRIYLPPGFDMEPLVGNWTIPAIGTEGEKKALACAQAIKQAGKQGQYFVYALGGL
jgi:hypothetical protein